ncbi:hypothetical protein [Brachybacterium subflavum]|uniref:hypothetical protein n=1 Tax=Brachybacterium subflavum TaxID=2585206 RepID=UPI0018793896|nr:hypothetical protein [Brachybacterium subflavum]
MGYREWRARLLERTDAMAERADARAEAAQAKQDRAKAEIAERREADAEAALRSWMLERADALHVDHDEMVERAKRVGLGLPTPHEARGLERVANGMTAATSVLPGSSVVRAVAAVDLAADGSVDASGQSRPDPYMAWVNLIRVEERVAKYEADGQPVPLHERALLRSARWALEHS